MTLVVHPHFHPRRTGVTRHVESIVTALGRLGEARALPSFAGRDVLEAELPRLRWRELFRRARREPVIWHAHRNNELLTGLLLRRLGLDLRIVFTRHAAHSPSGLTRWLAARSSAVVALTDEVASQMALPSVVVGHGVELETFRPSTQREDEWAALGLGGRIGIGVVGRVRPSKGQGDFVDAVAPLLQRHPECRAVLVGAVQSGDAAFAKSLEEKTGGELILAGEQSDPARWYRALSIVVQPSHSEGFSMVLLEAMASGCCVVAARLPHFPTLIDEGRTGFLYPPGDVAALRSILERLLDDPERVRAVGAAAAEEARRRFGVGNEAASLQSIYAGLVGR